MHWLLLLVVPVLVGAGESTFTLERCYRAAAERSEIVADRRELIAQAEEHYKQAIGTMLPEVKGVASLQTQEGPHAPTSREVKVALMQPLFHGFRDLAALRQTKLTRAALVAARDQAMADLYNDVNLGFYGILSLEQDLSNLQTEIELYIQRIKELNGRIGIGRSRTSEILTVQSALANLRVQVEQLKGQLAATREAFGFLTGLPADVVLAAKLPQTVGPEAITLQPLSDYLSAREGRPDLRAAKLQADAAREGTKIAKEGHLPAVDLAANYYIDRSGANHDVNWDAGVSLTLPIFNGGITQSKVREAASVEREAELNLGRLRRLAESQIVALYKSLESERDQLQTLAEANRISEKTYKVQNHDYRLGLVTNLDVLQAMTVYQESKRALDRAYFSAQIDLVKLETAVARSPFKVE